MAILTNILPWAQIALAVLLTVCILLQRSAEGLGGALGGGDMGGVRYTRRGFEKFLFIISKPLDNAKTLEAIKKFDR